MLQTITRPQFQPRNMAGISVAPSRRPFPIARFTPRPHRSWKPAISGPQSPSMGQTFSWSGLKTAVPKGLGGIALAYLGGVLPQPLSALSVVTGIGLMGWGVLDLFSGEDEVEKGTQFPSPSDATFPLITATVLKPKGNAVVPLGAFSGDYDVEILWTNGSDEKTTFAWDIFVREQPFGIFSGDTLSGLVYSGAMSLEAGGQEIMPVEIDLLTGSFSAKWGSTAIALQVRKYDNAGKAVVVAEKNFTV